MTPTTTNGKWTKAAKKKLADELYDTIMGSIESDLIKTSSQLDEQYAHETPEEKATRMDRYKMAFGKFDEELIAYLGHVKEKTRSSKRMALKNKEQENTNKERKLLMSLETRFS